MPPVSVTLPYTSLEDAITDLAKLRVGTVKPDPKPETTKADAATPAPAAETKPKATKPKAETPAPAPADPPAAAPAPVEFDYDTDVAPAIAKAVTGNRAEVIEILTRFGAKTGKQIKPADYGDFLEQLANRIDAVKAKADADLT